MLPPRLAGTHDVFHVSVLRKYVFDPSHIIDFTSLELEEDLGNHEYPMRIHARETKELRNRVRPFVKVQWSRHDEREATWNAEDELRISHPHLFEIPS